MTTKSIEEIRSHSPSPSAPGLGQCIGNPSPLAMGTFATTLLTLSLSMMGFRGVETQKIFIGNLCFAAGLCMFVSAQWEMARGNTFGYSALSAYAVFYGGYGVILCPSLGVLDSYGGPTPEYHNALGFYVLIWAVLTLFFMLGSAPINLVSFGIFTTIFFCFTLDAASNFAHADGKVEVAKNLMKAAGVFGFVSGLLGYYSCAAAMCADALPFELPCGDTSRFFKKTRKQL
ncbi:related to Y.lipolytica GPR1 protein and Fun34p [Fusarium fujikuroi]|nr:related to Y.lipolytica GPR1 protein and Fun34p [Fusarium fujikuroi]